MKKIKYLKHEIKKLFKNKDFFKDTFKKIRYVMLSPETNKTKRI